MKEFKPIRIKKNGEPDMRFKNAKQLATNINARKNLDRKLSEAKLVKEREYAKEKATKWTRFWHLVKLLFAVGLVWLGVGLWGHLWITYKNAVYVNPEPYNPILESCIGNTCIDQDNNQTTWIFNVARAQGPELSIEDKIRAYDWDDSLMLAIARWESSGYACEFRPEAINDKYNSDGSEDRGLLQINSNTFADFQRRHGDEMLARGIRGYGDMFDVDKNIAMGYIIIQEQGYKAFSSYNSGVFQSCGGVN